MAVLGWSADGWLLGSHVSIAVVIVVIVPLVFLNRLGSRGGGGRFWRCWRCCWGFTIINVDLHVDCCS